MASRSSRAPCKTTQRTAARIPCHAKPATTPGTAANMARLSIASIPHQDAANLLPAHTDVVPMCKVAAAIGCKVRQQMFRNLFI